MQNEQWCAQMLKAAFQNIVGNDRLYWWLCSGVRRHVPQQVIPAASSNQCNVYAVSITWVPFAYNTKVEHNADIAKGRPVLPQATHTHTRSLNHSFIHSPTQPHTTSATVHVSIAQLTQSIYLNNGNIQNIRIELPTVSSSSACGKVSRSICPQMAINWDRQPWLLPQPQPYIHTLIDIRFLTCSSLTWFRYGWWTPYGIGINYHSDRTSICRSAQFWSTKDCHDAAHGYAFLNDYNIIQFTFLLTNLNGNKKQ